MVMRWFREFCGMYPWIKALRVILKKALHEIHTVLIKNVHEYGQREINFV